jgi:tetratricopeptide (TPR) repeat protein/thioredoxin-like negative regulator of GroEL
MTRRSAPHKAAPHRRPEPSSIDVTEDVELEELDANLEAADIELEEDAGGGAVPPDSYSVDNLLALTGEEEDWDIDAHARSLKQAAGTPRRDAPARRGAPALLLPSPVDLGARPRSAPLSEVSPPPSRDRGRSIPAPPNQPLPSPSAPPGRPTGRTAPPPPVSGGSRRPLQEVSPTSFLSVGAAQGSGQSVSRSLSEANSVAGLSELLLARIVHLEGADDPVGLSRAHMELAFASEILGDETRATVQLEAALRVNPNLPLAHGMLRRRIHAHSALGDMLAHLEHEIRGAAVEAGTVGLLAERARLLEAKGDEPRVVQKAWEQVLQKSPNNGAALKGLETQLAQRDDRDAHEQRARHLAAMAAAFASQPELAAWLLVERAKLLSDKLGRNDEARAALEQAVLLDPAVGPVRQAYVLFLAAQDDAGTLVAMLDDEAQLETRSPRSARLELDAAVIASRRLSDDARAIALLERAAARAPTEASLDLRVLEELILLYERGLQEREALRARRARLGFLSEPNQVIYELRRLAALAERLGDFDAAAADLTRARTLAPDDPTLLEQLDRILQQVEHHEARKALWVAEASRAQQPKLVAKHLCRAARIAEALDERDEAIAHLEAARLVAPSDGEVVDELARLLAPAPSEGTDGESRRLIELYTVAMTKAGDPDRKVAYLEKVALLWEDIIGDAKRAARAYEEILTLDPGRRSAVLGLARTANRASDARIQARALLEEAKACQHEEEARDLKVRAATALAPLDTARALAVVQEVLAQDSAHHEARRLETRLHEDTGRWELACASLRARIEHTHQRVEKVKLLLALSQLQSNSLHDDDEAIQTLKAARALDPHHLVPPAEIARILTERGDESALRQAYEGLASSATTPKERALFLTRAAEVEEFRNHDDAAAARLYIQALVEHQEDELAFERLRRVLARRSKAAQERDGRSTAGLAERITLLSKRLERVSDRTARQTISFELAELIVDLGQDVTRAVTLLEGIQAEQPGNVAVLRTLESVFRRGGAWSSLARVLSLQGDNFVDARARLGALWSLSAIEEWRLADQGSSDTYDRILEIDPTDGCALEAVLRTRIDDARKGELPAVMLTITALRAFAGFAADDTGRMLAEVQLALILEYWGEPHGAAFLREALDRYAVAVAIDRTSVAAATGLARLGNRLGDVAAAVEAASSLAELSRQKPKVRARYLLDCANLLLSEQADDRLGPPRIRSDRAASYLEEALEVDPDAIAAAAALSTLRAERGEQAALVDTLRSTILRATSADAIVMLGTEIATVARDALRDLPVAVEAMKRVRDVAPSHTPSLLTLSELYIASRQWDLATETLETVAQGSTDQQARLTALFALARIYEKVTKSMDDAERVLRAALELDPRGPRALRALLHRLASKQADLGGSPAEATANRGEIADLLERLSEVERDPEAKAGILVELADVRQELTQVGPAERALIEAIAQAPNNRTAFAKLARLLRQDPAAYARALTHVLTRGRELGNADPRWLASLGHVEIEKLGRVREGVAHLKAAVRMNPDLHESRFEMASALARMGANDEAARTLLDMITPDARPVMSVADPAAAFDLLERTLNAERRPEEAIVVSELRAIAGDLDDGRQAWLGARRLPPLETHHAPLDRATLFGHVLPRIATHPLMDVAHAVYGLEAKLLRADLTDLGIASRDRVGRGHPARALLDRVARAVGVTDVELIISPTVNRTRVLVQDEPWIVMPKKLTELREPTQLATLARSVAKLALNVPWLEELPPPHIEAYLIACARQVVPGYGADQVDVISARLVAQYEATVAKALSRKQRNRLEEIAPRLANADARPVPIDALTGALAQGELRIAYLLTGDLLATIDELRGLDAAFLKETDTPGRTALGAVLTHLFAGDVCRFALTPEATALRRRVGATWAG